MEDLWDDLAAAPETVPVHDWQKQELACRKANLLKSPDSGLRWDEVNLKIRAWPLNWSVDACLERVRRRPEMYPIIHDTCRRSLTRRFPYAVFYEQTETKVSIYAVFHTGRDPNKWR